MFLLERKIQTLEKEFEELQEKFLNVENAKTSFEKKNEILKHELLTFSLPILSSSQKSFDMIITSKKCTFDKKGLGYKSSKEPKVFQKLFYERIL